MGGEVGVRSPFLGTCALKPALYFGTLPQKLDGQRLRGSYNSYP